MQTYDRAERSRSYTWGDTWKPTGSKANCHFIKARHVPMVAACSGEGWLFYSYQTPVAYIPEAGPVLITERTFSHTTSGQLSRYCREAVLGLFENCPVPRRVAFNPVKVPQSVLNAIAQENGLGTGLG